MAVVAVMGAEMIVRRGLLLGRRRVLLVLEMMLVLGMLGRRRGVLVDGGETAVMLLLILDR